jgi:hypothetical protein
MSYSFQVSGTVWHFGKSDRTYPMPRGKGAAVRQYRDIRRRFGFDVPPHIITHMDAVRKTFFDIID